MLAGQDVVQFGPLGATLLGQVQSQPGSIPAILAHVGALPILDWTRHFLALGAPTLHHNSKPTPKVPDACGHAAHPGLDAPLPGSRCASPTLLASNLISELL